MDIQHVFNEYEAVIYMCQYSISRKLKISVHKPQNKEAFENNIHDLDTMKTIARPYISHRECSLQEAVSHILPELKLRRIFPAVYFVNTNLPEERIQVLFTE